MEKLLVVGIDTLAGSNIALALAGRCEIVGVSGSAHFALNDCRVLSGCLADSRQLHESIANEKPNWTVYCGPSSRSSWDSIEGIDPAQEVRQLSEAANVARACGSHFTLISTDAIFRGPNLFHRESFAPSDRPSTVAIRRVEQAVAGTDALVVRTHLFGWSPAGDSFTERIWDSVSYGRAPTSSGSRYASPILASDFAQLLWLAINKGLTGTHHLAGAERISMWQFARLIALANGGSISDSAHEPRLAIAALNAINRTEETSLDSRKIQRLLTTPLSMIRDGIDRFAEQATSGYRDRLQTAWTERMPAAA